MASERTYKDVVGAANAAYRKVQDPSGSAGMLLRDDAECENLVAEVEKHQNGVFERVCKEYNFNAKERELIKQRLSPFFQSNLNRAAEKQARGRKAAAVAAATGAFEAAVTGFDSVARTPYGPDNEAAVKDDIANNWSNVLGAFMQKCDIEGKGEEQARLEFRKFAQGKAAEWYDRVMATVTNDADKGKLDKAFFSGEVFKEGHDLAFMARHVREGVPDMTPLRTGLTREERAAFNEARKSLPKGVDAADYDLEGLWLALGKPEKLDVDPDNNGLMEYELPTHPQFSTVSRFSSDEARGGEWGVDGDGKPVFTPSEFNRKMAAARRPFDYAAEKEIRRLGDARYRQNKAEIAEHERETRKALDEQYRETVLRHMDAKNPPSETTLLAEREKVYADAETYKGNADMKERMLKHYDARIKEAVGRRFDDRVLALMDMAPGSVAAEYEAMGRDARLRSVDPDRAARFMRQAQAIREADAKEAAAATAREIKANENDLSHRLVQYELARSEGTATAAELGRAKADLVADYLALVSRRAISPEKAESLKRKLTDVSTDEELRAIRRLCNETGFVADFTTDGRVTRESAKDIAKDTKTVYGFGEAESIPYTGVQMLNLVDELKRRMRELPEGVNREEYMERTIKDLKAYKWEEDFDAAKADIMSLAHAEKVGLSRRVAFEKSRARSAFLVGDAAPTLGNAEAAGMVMSDLERLILMDDEEFEEWKTANGKTGDKAGTAGTKKED